MAETIVVTPEGLKKLQDELEYLKTVKRKDNVEAIRVALSFGDLSENSEYDEAKTEQGKTESRIIELEEMLKHVTIIEEGSTASDKVTAGKTVRVLNTATGKEMVYTIVGPTEADPFQKKISDQSPIGVALVGKKVDEEVTADTPKGSIVFKILELI